MNAPPNAMGQKPSCMGVKMSFRGKPTAEKKIKECCLCIGEQGGEGKGCVENGVEECAPQAAAPVADPVADLGPVDTSNLPALAKSLAPLLKELLYTGGVGACAGGGSSYGPRAMMQRGRGDTQQTRRWGR